MSQYNMTCDEFYALRKAEGLKVDPRTAYVVSWYALGGNPYGIIEDRAEEYEDYVTRTYFARAPGSDMWVEFGDLPAETLNGLTDRLRARKPAETVPFNDRLERMADAIGAIYGPDDRDELNDRARALEAAQAVLDALEQYDAKGASDRSGETSGD